MLVYMDYFKHIHKMELGKKILCCWELSISCTWICRFTEKAFRKLSKNVKAGTVHVLPDVQQFLSTGASPAATRALVLS